MFDLVPAFAERFRGAHREGRLVGMAVPEYFRKPFGPGWALVGDAGYNKDFITAQGIQDAFRDAELCVRALDEVFSGRRPFQEAMADYQAARDEHAPDVRAHRGDRLAGATARGAAAGPGSGARQPGSDGWLRARQRGSPSPREFFSEENVERILAAAR